MMTLLFLLITLAIFALLIGRVQASYICFAISLALSCYWFSYHASAQLSIVL